VSSKRNRRGRRSSAILAAMTKPLPFTVAAIARAIEGARKAGLPITATSVNVMDGTVTIHHQGVAVPTISPRDDDEWKDA
jgi:hypothetical protein